ncbi:E3 ubiquitin-protein ligase TRIM39-like [Sparus aurata]|uniref:E3 ubiquitin-protein ligase TRIM39-like n=1 Tax=Sparus aurata TaxID=8175 RepID=UPI0011C10B3B|nr:E3 ubiquitin-protein ligase TRIM39-like [Sparus aurata]XP_030275700.1 E3 ubiquitin-protein ligase TRIM39-like [Sparus aurata]
MASVSEEDLSCPVCHDVYKDPVVLSCSHSVCRDCLQSWWRGKQKKQCPVCKARSLTSDPPRNLALKNLCESFVLKKDDRPSTGSEPLCSLHGEKLKLFCLDHQQPVCVVCRDSKTHNNHRFRPIDEAAQDLKEELQKSLKPLQDKLKVFKQVKENCDQTAEHIKSQAQHTESRIKEQFKKLHQFLEEEEEARISALREEEEQKSQMMKKKTKALKRDIAALSDMVKAAEEEELRAADVSFLQNYKATVKRVQQRPLLEDPQLVSGALIDEAKHLGNLSCNIWIKMKEKVSYTPVVLDPNSAHPELLLSEDLTSVRRAEKQILPENPERFDYHPSVLGCEGFDSGTHSWDVKVGDSTDWSVGVAAKSVKRKGNIKSKLWRLKFSDGKYSACSPAKTPVDLSGKKKLKKPKYQLIRVNLEREKHELSFTDPDTDTLIHTFTCAFSKKLFPYICNKDKNPIEILPQEDDDSDDSDNSDDSDDNNVSDDSNDSDNSDDSNDSDNSDDSEDEDEDDPSSSDDDANDHCSIADYLFD